MSSLFVLLLAAVLATSSARCGAPGDELVVRTFEICHDTVGNPWRGEEFGIALAELRLEYRLRHRDPASPTSLFGQWNTGSRHEPFAGDDDALPPYRDPWGRLFFEREAEDGSWSVADTNGVHWLLCRVDDDTSDRDRPPRFPRYELSRDGEVEASFTAAAATLPGLAAAWVHGDTCVVEYRYSDYQKLPDRSWSPLYRRVLVNGRDLGTEGSYASCFGFIYLEGRPFFFFERDGEVGCRYDGRDILFDVDLLFRDVCCESARWSPYFTRGGFEAIGRRDDTWLLIYGTVIPIP